MRAVVLTEDRPTLRLEEVDEPRAVADEVVLEVNACGICGSDLHVAGQVGAPGTILGHEIAGRIAELGPDVSLIHLAAWHPPATAATSADDRRELLSTNVHGTMRALDAAREAGLEF